MLNENEEIITPDEETDEEVLEEVEEETTEEVVEEAETTEEPEEKKPTLTREEKLAKAEAMVKRYSPKDKKVKTQTKQDNNPLSREEAILYAQGNSVEDVEDAKFIAEKDDITLTEATETSRFKALKKDRDTETKNNKAQQLASRGAKAPSKVGLSDTNLDRDAHMKLAKERMGQ